MTNRRAGSSLFWRVAVLTALLGHGSLAQKAPSADAVLSRWDETFADVKDFTARVSATIEMERIRVPRMEAKIYYKKPDKFHVESTGFMMLPREGMALDPGLLRSRYRAQQEGPDTADGRATYRLHLTALKPGQGLREMTVWIDRTSWTPVRMQTVPYEGRSLRISFEYVNVQGSIWLPSVVRAAFDAEAGEAEQPAMPEGPGQNYPQPQRQLPRTGSMTVHYSDYRVNAGIPDAVFEKAEPPAPTKKR